MNIKDLIFTELSNLEELVNETSLNSNNGQDLEVNILNKQIQVLKDKNSKAIDLIDKSISVLKNIK